VIITYRRFLVETYEFVGVYLSVVILLSKSPGCRWSPHKAASRSRSFPYNSMHGKVRSSRIIVYCVGTIAAMDIRRSTSSTDLRRQQSILAPLVQLQPTLSTSKDHEEGVRARASSHSCSPSIVRNCFCRRCPLHRR
jgi:hypothetical protein